MLRKYIMSDGKLLEKANQILMAANRDAAQLLNYDIDQTAIDSISQQFDDFSDLPADIELSSMMNEATLAKNNKRKEAADYIMTEIMMRVSLVFEHDSRKYKRFRINTIYNETDGDFYLLLKRVKRQAGMWLPQLSARGLNITHINALGTFITDFEALWEMQDQAIGDRKHAVETRIEAGNALYASLNELANIGKQIWGRNNESKYNDYVIYPLQKKKVKSKK